MVSVSAQEVMRLDVVSYQTIQGRVGMEIHTVVIVRCDVPGDQGRIHATLKEAMRKLCKVDVSYKLTECCDGYILASISSAIMCT